MPKRTMTSSSPYKGNGQIYDKTPYRCKSAEIWLGLKRDCWIL